MRGYANPMSILPHLLVVAVLCASAGRAFADADSIRLAGSPQAIGTAWGRLNARFIQDDMRANYIEPAAAKGFSEPELVARGRRFAEIAAEVAPHWLDEARAIADAAGVDRELYIAYIGCVYRNLWAGDECTSYAVSKRFTEDQAVFFHKNRDNIDKPQAACVVDSNLPGVNRFLTVTDVSVLACMMMVNDKGLAGSADTGGLDPGSPKFRGLMNTFILRHIAERAASCAEAEAVIRDFVAKGYYAGGGGTGTHWLFVDKGGAILEVANNADEVVAKPFAGKVYFSARADSNAAKTLAGSSDPIDFHAFHNVSRDSSMCFDSSISGMTVEISPEHPDLLTCAWITFPAKGLAFPLFIGCAETPLPLVDGEVYRLCKPLDGAAEVWEAVEESARGNQGLVEARAADLLDAGQRDRAVALLEEWTSITARGQVAMLRFTQN